MKKITANFEERDGQFILSVQIDGKYIVPRPGMLPADLTEREKQICEKINDLYHVVYKETFDRKFRVPWCPHNGCFMQNGAAPAVMITCSCISPVTNTNTQYAHLKYCPNCKRCSRCHRIVKKHKDLIEGLD